MSSPDFTSLLSQTAGSAKRPEPLPIGDYDAVIRAWTADDKNQKNTPYIRFTVQLTAPRDGVELPPDVDLAKRGTLRRDYYLTHEAQWRLDQLLRSLGLIQEGEATSYLEILPQTVGQPVIASVGQYTRNASPGQVPDVGNEIRDLTGHSS